ncbi:MAG: MlaD family protein [Solirubrobacteraceae bacterium]
MTAIRKHLKDFAAIVGLLIIGMVVAVYILDQQRLRFPFVEAEPFHLKAEFSTAQAVTPGQGQTVRVSGVRIGDIAKTELKDGVAIVTMDIDLEYKDLVHTDATALLRPKTGLKDMFIALDPGSQDEPVAEENWAIPVNNTLPDINPDEVLQFLDADSRDYLKLLVNGAGRGLEGRGNDLQEVFARFEPTHRDLAKVTSAVAVRHGNLRRLITSLEELNTELAGKGAEVSSLVSTSAEVFRAFASEEQNISRAVRVLPGALRQTTETLQKVEGYAGVLGSATEALRPVAPSLDAANKATIPFALEAAPIIRDQIRPFTREAQPLVRTLRPAARNLAKATPDLTGTFSVLNNLFNMVGFNPNGTEGPSDNDRDEGFLFWLAWLNHNGGALFATSDANGPFRPVTLSAPCSTLKQIANEEAGESGNAIFSLVFSKPVFDTGLCG